MGFAMTITLMMICVAIILLVCWLIIHLFGLAVVLMFTPFGFLIAAMIIYEIITKILNKVSEKLFPDERDY